VIFPEVATLTAILAAPHWQAPADGGAPPAVDGLLGTAQRALGCADPAGRHDISDAPMLWAEHRAAGLLLESATVYPRTGHQDDGTPRVTDALQAAEQCIATYFRRGPARAPHLQPRSIAALRLPASTPQRPRPGTRIRRCVATTIQKPFLPVRCNDLPKRDDEPMSQGVALHPRPAGESRR
jgi:hypothetical protein